MPRTKRPTLRSIPILPKGPNWLRKKPTRVTGPGDPPPGFVYSHNSATEWYVYWGLWRVFHEQGDPRMPPFWGSPTGKWTYQVAVLGGRHTKGGAVLDFVVNGGRAGHQSIGIRVQTEHFHVFVDSVKKAFDRLQLISVSQSMKVVDIFEQDFISDHSGEAVCNLLARILNGQYLPDPELSGTQIRRKRG